MKYERQVRENGGSLLLAIPADLCKYLQLGPDDFVVIQDDKGKHGIYLSLWKRDQEKKVE